MRTVRLLEIYASLALLAGTAAPALAQDAEPSSRQTVIEEAQSEKVKTLQPYVPSRAERVITKVEDMFVAPSETWHPFFENAYSGSEFRPRLACNSPRCASARLIVLLPHGYAGHVCRRCPEIAHGAPLGAPLGPA